MNVSMIVFSCPSQWGILFSIANEIMKKHFSRGTNLIFPSSSESRPRRLERVHIRLTKDEKQQLERLANHENMSLSELVRRSCFQSNLPQSRHLDVLLTELQTIAQDIDHLYSTQLNAKISSLIQFLRQLYQENGL